MKEQLIARGLQPICGWQWLYQHLHDLDNWHPSIEILRDGAKYKISATSHKVINQAIREVTK